ncbi:MAG: Uma2 family endonuclease [Chitinophagaceae bacterium]|nr:MAG: Uma2 family endonuclease [Chitinophagaceae bacterium]
MEKMEGAYIHPPKTMLEVFENLPEGTLAQLINNQIYMSPSPSNSHQKVLDKVYRQLGNFVEEMQLGETRVAPFDVFLNQKNAFQPDIIFIANQNLHNIKERGLFGAPDLVIEILSPATRRFDKGEKKEVYERSGVKEYWMIDPADKTAEGFILQDGVFTSLPGGKGEIAQGF